MSRQLVFAVPGALAQRTGGYLYGQRVVNGLRAQGWAVQVAELAGRFPLADDRARAAAAQAIDAAPANATVVIDGLALPAFDRVLLRATARQPVLGFIHHPLSLETGLSAGLAARLGSIECALWSRLDGLVCASSNTARAARAAGICPARIAVAEPGVDLPSEPVVRQRTVPPGSPVRLLCVATVTPRKNHRMLVQALARVRTRSWRLDCIGSLDRDAQTVAMLRSLIAEHGLDAHVVLHGEQSDDRLDAAWREADLFVLASDHEGYGMVLTEALAHGVPVVATRAGAIPETIPASACRLVAPGDVAALARVLDRLITERAALGALAEGARAARPSLVPWPQAVSRWGAAVQALGTRPMP